MLEFMSENPWAYGFVALTLATFAIGIWHGISEIREESRRYSALVGDLFSTASHDEVVKNSRYPHGSVVGRIEIDGISKVKLVLQGRDGLFIDQGKKAPWLSISWNRIARIEKESAKRIVVYVKRETRPPIALSLPWSGDMSLENWDAYQATVE